MGVVRLMVPGTLVVAALGSSVRAQSTSSPVTAEQPAQPETSDKASEQEKAPTIATSLPGPLADPGGLRSSVEAAGIAYSITYIGKVLGNTRGGVRRDTVYGGRLDLQVDADLGRNSRGNGQNRTGNAPSDTRSEWNYTFSTNQDDVVKKVPA